jgi:hypothetical protein
LRSSGDEHDVVVLVLFLPVDQMEHWAVSGLLVLPVYPQILRPLESLIDRPQQTHWGAVCVHLVEEWGLSEAVKMVLPRD